MRYRRLSDNQMVQDSEAVDASGALRSGYAMANAMLQPGQHIGFNVAFMDSLPAQPASAKLSPNDRAAIVAQAQATHHTRTAYLGDQAPAFTPAMAQAVLNSAEANAASVRDSRAAYVAPDAAYQASRQSLNNYVTNAYQS